MYGKFCPLIRLRVMWRHKGAAKYSIKQFGNFLGISHCRIFASKIMYADKIPRIQQLSSLSLLSFPSLSQFFKKVYNFEKNLIY